MATENKNPKDTSPTKATAPKDTPIVKEDKEQQKSVVNEPAVKPQDNQTVEAPAEQPAKVANQVDHALDSHTGAGTSFPAGSPMAVVPPSEKQVI